VTKEVEEKSETKIKAARGQNEKKNDKARIRKRRTK
jgi:hypothetical protein